MKAREERIYPTMHPGRVLELEFLEPLEMTLYRLAQSIGPRRRRYTTSCVASGASAQIWL